MEYTTVYDIENSNVRNYEKMFNQLNYTRFKINQIVPPLLLSDSSRLFNRRFFEKLLSEKLIDNKDTLMTEVNLDTNYHETQYRFEIFFKKFDIKKAYLKWDKYFEKQFIDSLANKRFVIVVDKQSLLPVDYKIFLDSNKFENYTDINIQIKNPLFHSNFNPFNFKPLPKKIWYTVLNKKSIYNWVEVEYNKYASDFYETAYLSNEKIKLYDYKSEYILLYVWNSLSVEDSRNFQEICKIAKENPEKLTIIGMNNYNETDDYVARIYNKYKWQFPTIKGKNICKAYSVSETPTFILIHLIKGNYCVSVAYIHEGSDYIFSVLKL